MDTKEWLGLISVTLASISLTYTFCKDWLARRRSKKEIEQPRNRMERFKSWLSTPHTAYLISISCILAALPFPILMLFIQSLSHDLK